MLNCGKFTWKEKLILSFVRPRQYIIASLTPESHLTSFVLSNLYVTHAHKVMRHRIVMV